MRVKCGRFTLEGHSVSTIETYVKVPELNLVFDIGCGPRDAVNLDHLLLTHAHQDHALGLTKYISTRGLLDMAAPTVYAPEVILPHLEQLIRAWEALECRRTRCDYHLVPMRHGVEVELRRGLKVHPFLTDHSVPSMGFAVIEERQKLKPEYLGRPGPEIAALRQSGADILYTVREPLVTFVGDSTIRPFDDYALVRESDVLILESTFLREDELVDAPRKKHTHLTQIVERLDGFKGRMLVLSHFSTRYTRSEVEETVWKAIPEVHRSKVRLLF